MTEGDGLQLQGQAGRKNSKNALDGTKNMKSGTARRISSKTEAILFGAPRADLPFREKVGEAFWPSFSTDSRRCRRVYSDRRRRGGILFGCRAVDAHQRAVSRGPARRPGLVWVDLPVAV